MVKIIKNAIKCKKCGDVIVSRQGVKDYLVELDREACLKLFDEYNAMDKELY